MENELDLKIDKSLKFIFEMMNYRKFTHYVIHPDIMINSNCKTIEEFIKDKTILIDKKLDSLEPLDGTNTPKTLLTRTLLFLKFKTGGTEILKSIFIIWFPIITIDISIHIEYLCSNFNFKKFIVIYSDKITSPVKNLPNKNIQYFHIDELQYNPTVHEWVPTHVVCLKSELEEVLKIYGVEKSNLPKISLNDPQIKWLGVPIGTLIRITRKNMETMPSITTDNVETKLPEITYRLVSN